MELDWVSIALWCGLYLASQEEAAEEPRLYDCSQWVVPKVFPRTFGLSTSLPSHSLPPLQHCFSQRWVFGCAGWTSRHSSALVPWPKASLLPTGLCNNALWPEAMLYACQLWSWRVSCGKDQNGSQMIGGQQVAERNPCLPQEEHLPRGKCWGRILISLYLEYQS